MKQGKGIFVKQGKGIFHDINYFVCVCCYAYMFRCSKTPYLVLLLLLLLQL